MHLASVVLPERCGQQWPRPSRRHVQRDPVQDGVRLGAAVAETDSAQRHAARQRRHRPQRRAVAPLLGLMLKDVVQAIEQHIAALQVVPEQQQAADRAVENATRE